MFYRQGALRPRRKACPAQDAGSLAISDASRRYSRHDKACMPTNNTRQWIRQRTSEILSLNTRLGRASRNQSIVYLPGYSRGVIKTT